MFGHTEEEIAPIREQYYDWWFDPFREGTNEAWAKAHQVNPHSLTNWRRRPEFTERRKNFRETYSESSDTAMQNLLRFANDENPRVAIPAIKITADVMGWNAPTQIEHSAEGMTLFQYLAAIDRAAQAALEGKKETPALSEGTTEPVLTAEFIEERDDPWVTSEPNLVMAN